MLKRDIKYVRQARLPDEAYPPKWKAIEYFAKGERFRDWCRICAHDIFNRRVVDYSLKHFGEIYCFNCQQLKKVNKNE